MLLRALDEGVIPDDSVVLHVGGQFEAYKRKFDTPDGGLDDGVESVGDVLRDLLGWEPAAPDVGRG